MATLKSTDSKNIKFRFEFDNILKEFNIKNDNSVNWLFKDFIDYIKSEKLEFAKNALTDFLIRSNFKEQFRAV